MNSERNAIFTQIVTSLGRNQK